ncbi:hypothetical protein JX265_004200 [Neoarthrinium moseri]|uniref:Indole-diterpene biosynthesis protein PaxU n=1 Tax=Neoarthrinium moseri TaxID=1658444 RepID=A0A9Q0ASN8_9PEZI|nr:hypothetical protein JX266_005964 [Neoarthrinium moseri]KAI1875142.1 hypothetical protein JX265_004200 [Neoarthrinium moseri]
MADTKNRSRFPGFIKLSDQVYLRPADDTNNTAVISGSPDPTTILLYAWGDAQPKHIAKYISGYLALFPNARLLIVLGPMIKMFYKSHEQRSKGMEVVLNAMQGAESAEERVLVHAMSNTGGVNYAATLNAYSQRYPGGSPLVHTLSVFDSTPGSSSFFANLGPWSRAMAIGAASWFPGPLFIMQAFAIIFLLVTHGVMFALGHSSPAVFSTKAINNPELEDKAAARLYLYSKSDEIINWEAVEEHAAEAKGKGFQVDLERFEETPHVGHLRAHPEKYWAAVRGAWHRASSRK